MRHHQYDLKIDTYTERHWRETVDIFIDSPWLRKVMTLEGTGWRNLYKRMLVRLRSFPFGITRGWRWDGSGVGPKGPKVLRVFSRTKSHPTTVEAEEETFQSASGLWLIVWLDWVTLFCGTAYCTDLFYCSWLLQFSGVNTPPFSGR